MSLAIGWISLTLAASLPPNAPPGSLWSEPEARALMGMNGNARQVGDLITVHILEEASTSMGAKTKTTRKGSSAAGIDSLLGADASILRNNPNMGGSISLGGTSETSHDGQGQTSREGSLTAVLTCEVVDVLPNGNLKIRGVKEVTVNRETQYITLEGVVRPRDIQIDNTVPSNLISDARIEYTGQGVMADKQGVGWGMRVVDKIWPF